MLNETANLMLRCFDKVKASKHLNPSFEAFFEMKNAPQDEAGDLHHV
jgi:hypothetical protein